jgi:GTP-binding protein HflX
MEPNSVFVSARTGEGIEELLARVATLLPTPQLEVDALVPYDRGDLVAMVHERGTVLELAYEEGGTRVHAQVGAEDRAALEPYLVGDTPDS